MPSTVISRFTYEEHGQVLIVEFVSGLRYRYTGVPAEVYQEMRSSFGKGIFLNRFIKGKYPFEKIEMLPGEPS